MSLRPEMRKALLELDNSAVDNDTKDPVQRVVGKLLVGGTEITYGGIVFVAEQRVVDQAREVLAELSTEERRRMQASIDPALGKNHRKIQRGRFSKKVA